MTTPQTLTNGPPSPAASNSQLEHATSPPAVPAHPRLQYGGYDRFELELEVHIYIYTPTITVTITITVTVTYRQTKKTILKIH
jgi:hypothetical protein